MQNRLTCDKARWSEDSDGFWVSFRTKNRFEAVAIAQSVDGERTVEVKHKKALRSMDANAYLWVMLDKLSEAIREPKTELYRRLIPDVGGNVEVVCVVDKAVNKLRDGWEHNGIGWVTDTTPSKIEGCTNVLLYYGSSTYDTRQMTRLIDLVVAECKQLGIETLTPAELERLEGYGGQYHAR